MSMVSVRFTPSMIAWVRYFAKKDGLTVSQWLRKLVDREVRNYHPPVDVSRYPMAVTMSSGADTKVTYSFEPPSATGWTWPS